MKKFPIFILIIAFIFAALSSVYGDASCGKVTSQNTPEPKPYSTLKKAKELLDSEKYSEALGSLKAAYEELPVIRDYTLFFMAKAYTKMDRLEDANNCIDELLKAYPDSLLRKKAKALKIQNIIIKSEDPRSISDAAIKYLRQYVNEYPEDAEAMFMLGQLMKSRGETEAAQKMFRQLYIANNSYSELSFQELPPSRVTADDLLAKALNYMKSMEYKRAENLLRNALLICDNSSRADIQKMLATSLFRQKRYKDAAPAYLKTGDIYNAARSFYRNGDMDSFNRMLSKLVAMEDRRAGSLLLLQASHKRRDGDIEGSLKIYRDASMKYPSLAEDAIWGIVWTYYRSGDCQNSLTTLRELHDKHLSPKYIYWKQKCENGTSASSSMSIKPAPADNEEGHSSHSYIEGQKRRGVKPDFYSLLLLLHDIERLNGHSVSQVTWNPDYADRMRSILTPPSETLPDMERVNILLELGMKENAVSELINVSHRVSGPEVIIYLSHKLQEIGAYKKSISVASMISADSTDVNSILYPFAYWPVVSEVSQQYALDPYILLSVIREESRFDPDAQSVAGALGLMQIMPQTAYNLDQKLKIEISSRNEIFDVRINITLGAYYLTSLLNEFGSLPVALAAYNAGEEKVREWLKKGSYRSPDEFIEDIPYDETRNYVKRILLSYAIYLDMNDRLQN